MPHGRLIIQAVVAFLVLPGLFAFLAPLIIGYTDSWGAPFFTPGLVVVGAGVMFLLWCVRDFYVVGKGTLAPWHPPKDLVRVGFYRFVRNPMYLSLFVIVFGWGMFFWSPVLIGYDIVLLTVFHIRVVRVEEPRLSGLFAESWETYKKNVPRWIPRRTAWNMNHNDS